MQRNRRPDSVVSKTSSAADVTERFRHLIQVLDRGGKLLEEAGADKDICMMYRRLLSHLRSRSETEIEAMVGENARPKGKRAAPTLRNEHEVAQLTREQIGIILEDDTQSRAQLAQIASLRFGMSSSAVTQLRSRQALLEKLKTMIEHEQVQDSIARVAGAKDENAT